MDNRTFAGLLAATPPVDLSIIELTAELTRPDGSFDLDAAAARQQTWRWPASRRRTTRRPRAAAGGAEMATAAPAQLSGLAKLLLRRPPSLRELVTLVGYADDYAWFVGLVRRLFPQEAEAALAAPDVRGRVERFANLFGERHFPLYAPFIEFWTEEEGDEPPWSWLRKGIPFDLMGFGYDGLHEMWDGYREGLSAMALLVKPPDPYYEGPDGLRVAWLESAAARIPQETLLRIPQGGIPLDDLTEALKGTRFEGAAQACSWVLAETGNFFLDHTYEDGNRTTASPTPGTTTSSRRGRRSGARPAPSWTRCASWATGWRRTSPAASPRCWTSRWSGFPTKKRRKTNMTNEVDTTRWSLPGPADAARDDLKLQLEVYGETILLRGFENDAAWVRTVSADEIANVFTQHLGFSSGLLPEETLWWNQGETGQVVALWRPPQVWSVALQREAFKPPARLRLPMPGLVFVCSPGRAPWVYAALGRPNDPEQLLFRAPAFNVFRDGRVCPGSHRFPEEVGLIPEGFFQSFFSLTGDTRDRSKKHPDNLQALWEEIDGTTAYPAEDLVPQCTVGQAMAVSEGRRGHRF